MFNEHHHEQFISAVLYECQGMATAILCHTEAPPSWKRFTTNKNTDGDVVRFNDICNDFHFCNFSNVKNTSAWLYYIASLLIFHFLFYEGKLSFQLRAAVWQVQFCAEQRVSYALIVDVYVTVCDSISVWLSSAC